MCENGILTACRDPTVRRSPLQAEIFDCKNGMLRGIRRRTYCKRVATGQIRLHQSASCELNDFCCVNQSPSALTSVMSIKAACIEDERFARPHVDPRIRVPKIAVHERGFQRPAVALKWAQKTRYDLIEERWN